MKPPLPHWAWSLYIYGAPQLFGFNIAYDFIRFVHYSKASAPAFAAIWSVLWNILALVIYHENFKWWNNKRRTAKCTK